MWSGSVKMKSRIRICIRFYGFAPMDAKNKVRRYEGHLKVQFTEL